LLKDSGIDARHDMDIDELFCHAGWRQAYEKSLVIVREKKGILILCGDKGPGKTQCAQSVIKELCLRDGLFCQYYRTSQMIDILLDHQAENQRTAAIEKFCRPYLLVLDEVQKIKGTEYERNRMDLIIDIRYGKMKPTILIFNCNEKDACDILGASVTDRIREGGGLIDFPWKSFRGQQPGSNTW